MSFLFVTWNVNPEIFHLGPFNLEWFRFFQLGPISVRWYGLLFAMGFVTGYLLFQKFFEKEGIKEELLDKLTIYMALGTIIGARLGHVIFYDPAYYFSHPLNILKVWEGGLASHGAAIGILLSLWLFVRKYRVSYLWTLDRIVITVALAGFFIRMGNLMNSEIYGIQTNLPWGFIFERNNETVPKHPTQIYEALSYLLIFALLLFMYFKKFNTLKLGLTFGIFLILLFSARFFIEFIKEDQSDFESGMLLNMGQWLSIPFILAGVFLVYRALTHKELSRATQGTLYKNLRR